MKILNRFNGSILFENKSRSISATLKAALKVEADLKWANLKWANLKGADLKGANLEGADLEGADLKWANLKRANLKRADLKGANLEGADLEGADLEGANLKGANLKWANLDFASWHFSCRSFRVKVDIRLVAQMAMHFCMLDAGEVEGFTEARNALVDLANQFHRSDVPRITKEATK